MKTIPQNITRYVKEQGLSEAELSVFWKAYTKYAELRNAFGHYNVGKEAVDKLITLTKKLVSNKWDPIAYLDAIARNNPCKDIYPNLLTGRQADGWYLEFKRTETVIAPVQALATELGYLQQIIKDYADGGVKQSVAQILFDDLKPFSAWFRILITDKPVPVIISKYIADAKEELKEDKALVDFLKSKGMDLTRLCM